MAIVPSPFHVLRWLALGLCCLSAGCDAEERSQPDSPPAPPADSLHQAYAEYFPIGAAVSDWHLEQMAGILTQDFNHLTAENAMKPHWLQPQEGAFDWGPADQLANFARTHQMKVTGHTLLWHRQAPEWMFAGLEPANAESVEVLKARLKAHIEAVVTRYADVVDNWDVVNEAISGANGKLFRDAAEGSQWYEYFGSEQYIYWAFLYARDALEANEPGSSVGKLYYNDFNVTTKVGKIATMLNWLESSGVRIDGIGFQSHERLRFPAAQSLRNAFEAFASAGYKLKVSELDVTVYDDYRTGSFVPEPEVEFTSDLEATQAARYAELFQVYREHRADITSVTFWGVSDDRTWLDYEPVLGRNDHPLLYDDAHEPKAARAAILDF